MKIHRHIEKLPENVRGSVVVLGNFDGFHKGHQKVVGRAGKIARETNRSLSVVVVEPHPRIFFNPALPDFQLTSFRTKARLLEDFGVDHLFVLPFDEKLSQTKAEDFILDMLIKGIGASHIVSGYDYRFGAGRTGDVTMLGQLSERANFGYTMVEKVMEGDHIYSSTNIRESLRSGNVREVADRLGHWWHVEGHVMKGDQRGRTIDFPTANLEMEGYIKPALGVYAVRVSIAGGPAQGHWMGVANVGKRPTFDKNDLTLEVHIFDFDFDIYENLLRVEFVDYIRAEQKFSGLEALKSQIKRDCLTAKEKLADGENARDLISIPRLKDHL